MLLIGLFFQPKEILARQDRQGQLDPQAQLVLPDHKE